MEGKTEELGNNGESNTRVALGWQESSTYFYFIVQNNLAFVY